MALASGTRIGPYEVVGPLGAGGMGEVYRATDTSLKRTVALKVLPEALATDPDRLARFQREAEVLASLNHPNIAHIHGLEAADGIKALVMELVEGPTLAERIAQGALPLEEALSIAKQIAEALEAAHEQGIVHRDLKPANVKVRDDGTVKVLDFGLAKAIESSGNAQSAASAQLSMSPTITTPAMTQLGVILGTAAYMAPEQAKGRGADRRSDVWAFGVVLFEMLTGRRAFDGEDMVETLGAVTRLDPDWSPLPETLPPHIRTLVRRCLQKDRGKRIANMSAVLFVLQELPTLAEGVGAHSAPRPPLWKRALPVAIGMAVAGAAAGGLAWTLKSTPPPQVSRSRFLLPGEQSANTAQQLSATSRQLVAISADGTQIAYAANRRLYLRSLSELDAREIQGTESGFSALTTNTPVFSPDGRSVAYWESGALKRIAVSGGAPVTLCKSDPLFGMSWSEDGIVFGQGAGGIMRVAVSGGTAEQLVRVEKGELAANPQMLPGRRAVLFTLAAGTSAQERWDAGRIVVQDLNSGTRTVLVEGGSHGRYVPTGHIVYAVGAVLLAVPFDVGRMQTTGTAVPVVEGVRRSLGVNSGTGAAQYSFSETGTLVFVPGPTSPSIGALEIVRFDRKGGTRKLELPPRAFGSVRISPDGGQLAFEIDDGKEANIWVYDMARNTAPRRLSFGGSNLFPIWSADGQYVVFQSNREGDQAIYRQRANGTGTAERLTRPDKGVSHIPESWSRRDERFSFSAVRGTEVSLWTFSMKDRAAVRFGDAQSTSPFNSVFSPDGRWVAYTLRGAGANIYVEPVPATGAKYQITTVNGHHPVWLPDGKGLSYRVDNNEQMVVSVDPTSGFSWGIPEKAVPVGLPGVLTTTSASYDITPDGAAFLAVSPPSGTQGPVVEAQEIDIVINWFEELKRLAPR